MLESKRTFSEGELIAGKYRVLSIAGSGGMGIVYCARDERLERTVALKFLPDELNTSDLDRERFLREARTASKLDHPNIGVVHGIETTENGLTFIVMAFYDGPTLADRISSRPSALGEAIAIVRQMAQGLGEAHSHGILHRDVKPSNVMLTESGLVKIVDFGLARVMTESTASQTGIAGTIRYMSPEQVMNGPLDQRCDLWALGVVFAEMLTGIAPFQADSVTGTLFSILNEPPNGLEGVHPDLRPVLHRTLAKDPERRYASCEEFLADLAAAEKQISHTDLGQEATRELPSSDRIGKSSAGRRRLEQNASRWSGRPQRGENRGWRAWLLAALIFVVAIGLAVWLIRPLRERVVAVVTGMPSVKRVAVLPFEVIGANPQGSALADGLMESFTGQLSNLDAGREPLWIVPTSEVRRRHVTDPAEALKLLGANLVIKGTVERNGNDIHLMVNLIDTENMRQVGSAMLQDPAGDLASLEDQATVRVARLMNIPVTADVRHDTQGKVGGSAYEDYLTALGLMQRWDKPGNIDQAIAVLENALKSDPEFALAYAEMGEAYRLKSIFESNRRWLDDAETNAEKAVKLNDQIPSAFVILGRLHTEAGKSDLALDEFQHALRLDSRNSDAISGLGRAYEVLGRLSDAEAAFRRAVDLRPDDWNGYNNLAMFLSRQEKYTEAIAQYRKALELAPDSGSLWMNLGGTYIDSGDPKYYPDAEAALKKAIALNPYFGAYANLGALYMRQGRYRESADLTEKALALNSQNYVVWENLRIDYEWLKETDKAREAAGHSKTLLERSIQSHPRDANAFGVLADLFALEHEREKALANLRTALAFAPDDMGILTLAADVYEDLGDRRRAVEYLKSAIKHGATKEILSSDPELQGVLTDPAIKGLLH